jgi:hypothetical protein
MLSGYAMHGRHCKSPGDAGTEVGWVGGAVKIESGKFMLAASRWPGAAQRAGNFSSGERRTYIIVSAISFAAARYQRA